MNIISRLFSRCQHEWETKMVNEIYRQSRVAPSVTRETGKAAYCQCKKCGAWKMFEMELEG